MRRRSPEAKKPDAGLEICPVCGRDFVQPVCWEPDGEAAWWMFLRCGECGISREVAVSNADADRFERALHARASVLAARCAAARGGAACRRSRRSSSAALEQDLIDAATSRLRPYAARVTLR